MAAVRYVFIIASLTLAICSITLDRLHPGADSWFCREGFCGAEQIAEPAVPAAVPANFASVINEDASDPYVWAAYADSLETSGEVAKAGGAMDQSVTLGPNLPAVLIRAAYFDFTHGQFDRGAALSSKILGETSAFDPLIFSYLQYYRKGSGTILGAGIPAAKRPAGAWAAWIGKNGSEDDARKTWGWMMQNHLMDRPSALDLTWELWQRQFFRSAHELWSDWLGPSRRDDSVGQLVVNSRFQDAADGSPFDWSIPRQAGVDVSRDHDHGLEIHFDGAENVKLHGVRQSIIVSPGKYRFAAVIQSDDLTTDQGPFFHIFDPQDLGRVDVRMPPIKGTTARSTIQRDLAVPGGTEALTIQIERIASGRFDNKITGTLHVYEVSLIRVGR